MTGLQQSATFLERWPEIHKLRSRVSTEAFVHRGHQKMRLMVDCERAVR